MERNSKDQKFLTPTLVIANSLSAIGCIFIITMKKSLFSLPLVVYMSIADLLQSISLIIRQYPILYVL